MAEPWAVVGHRLSECFDPIIAQVKASYPHIHAGNGWNAPVGYMKFLAHGSFCYDPASAEFEDLLLEFVCAPADRGFWNADGTPAFPGVVDRDAVKFEIARGTGLVLASLDPVLLPEDENSPEYEQAILDYADRACAFVDARTDLILEALRTPYLG